MTAVNVAWEYDNVDLTTLAYDVRSLGAPEDVPPRRGENIVVSGKRGRYHVSKAMDERHLILSMVCRAKDPSSGGTESASQLETNLDTLKGLFARSGQRTLKKQTPSGTYEATVECIGATFEPAGPMHYNVVVEFVFADPLWYDDEATTVGPTTITGGTQNITVQHDGTHEVTDPVITMVGPAVDPKFTISGVWVQYSGTVNAGGTLTVTCGSFVAANAGTTVTEDITHDGDIYWMKVPVGSADMEVISSGYDASTAVTLTFTEAYI